MFRVAAFIDAGYLWCQVAKALFGDKETHERRDIALDYKKLRSDLLAHVGVSFPGVPLLRCYWYDGTRRDGTPSPEHGEVAFLDDFKVKLGETVPIPGSGGKKKQKGVDGLIIADLIGLAQNKAISHALLVSGDGDLVPGVSTAQSMGVRVHLLAINDMASTSPALWQDVDHTDLWPTGKILRFAGKASEDGVAARDGGNGALAGPASPQTAEAGLAEMVQEFYAALTPSEKASLSGNYIPPAIDRQLLMKGCALRRSSRLEEDGKRRLRALLKECAHKNQ